MPNFVSVAPSIAELARGENRVLMSLTHSLTHSVTHSPSLFDSPGTEAFASEKRNMIGLHSVSGYRIYVLYEVSRVSAFTHTALRRLAGDPSTKEFRGLL